MCREISLQSDNNVHCENLIRRALIRADETLSHFSPGWEPFLARVQLQSKQQVKNPTRSCICPFLLGRAILRNSYCTLELFCCSVLLGPHFAGAMWQGAFCRVGGGKKGGTGHMASTGTARSGKSAKNDPGIPEIRPGQLELMVVNMIRTFFCITGKRLKLCDEF